MATERQSAGTLGWQLWCADHLTRYEFALGFSAGRRVLDVGTGSGYGAYMLKVHGAQFVQAVDLDPEAIARAKARYAMPGLEYLADNAEELSAASGPFDLVCSFENIEHLRQPDSFLRSAARLLAPEGILLCSTPAREFTGPTWINGKPPNPYHITEWYREEFAGMLNARFETVKMYSQLYTHHFVLGSQAALRAYRYTPAHIIDWLRVRVIRRPRTRIRFALSQRPTLGDIRIVPHELAEIYGTAFVHLAVCRGPKK